MKATRLHELVKGNHVLCFLRECPVDFFSSTKHSDSSLVEYVYNKLRENPIVARGLSHMYISRDNFSCLHDLVRMHHSCSSEGSVMQWYAAAILLGVTVDPYQGGVMMLGNIDKLNAHFRHKDPRVRLDGQEIMAMLPRVDDLLKTVSDGGQVEADRLEIMKSNADQFRRLTMPQQQVSSSQTAPVYPATPSNIPEAKYGPGGSGAGLSIRGYGLFHDVKALPGTGTPGTGTPGTGIPGTDETVSNPTPVRRALSTSW